MNVVSEIARIALPDMRPGAGSAPGEQTAETWFSSAQINAGAILALDKSLTGQDKSDISASLLFAQLAADAAHDKFTAPADWLKKFSEVLTIVGWAMTHISVSSPGDVPVPVDWKKLTLTSYRQYFGDSTLVDSTVARAAAASPGSAAARLWMAQTYGRGAGLYQLGLARRDQDGAPALNLLAISFALVPADTGILDWGAKVGVSTDEFGLVLNLDVYDRVRQQILEKLGPRLRTDIVAL